MIVKLAFRYFLAVAAWYRDSIPVSTQIDYIKQSGAGRKEFSGCYIVLRTEE